MNNYFIYYLPFTIYSHGLSISTTDYQLLTFLTTYLLPLTSYLLAPHSLFLIYLHHHRTMI